MRYEANIHWTTLNHQDDVYDLGPCWVVHKANGNEGLVFWLGEEAGKAQAYLAKHARRDRSPPPPIGTKRVWSAEEDADFAALKVKLAAEERAYRQNTQVISCRFPPPRHRR